MDSQKIADRNYDKSLRADLLPPELIIHKFIVNEKHCNYEDYLLELLNRSSFFLQKSHGDRYIPPETESHGECDCNAESYKIDFKLIASSTALQPRNTLSLGKVALADGVTLTTAPKRRNESIRTTIIYAALRSYSYEQLVQLRIAAPKKHGIERDVFQLLKKLETEKNLLLFFPYCFRFDHHYDFMDGVGQIQIALNGDFENAMRYRHNAVNGYDTYMAFIYDGNMVFMEKRSDQLCYIDHVSLKESPIYLKLLDYSDA